MIVAIEGADGCGKTTVAEALGRGLQAQVISFPDDTAVTGPVIRSYLRREWLVRARTDLGGLDGPRSEEIGALAFQALQVANRMERMPKLEAARQAGYDLVLCRYWQSGWVYGQLDGLDPSFLLSLHRSMVQPDLVILLDVDAEECVRRRALRDGGVEPERYEGKLDFTRKVVELYRQLWDLAPKMPGHTLWRAIDASREKPEEVLRIARAFCTEVREHEARR